ncbi:iron-containing alcohol dehydrogenase [Caldalkalibacillus salinus]|uniref:iron-containing alcohol dehydrogenase n=1 Tax=Caldalkalibacillus salinus TaxID=2803787 RepID=UPI001921088A|nr:iron-containing alcohol dehydrogenase [Caldalkalibacillus salinus]
MTIDFHLPTIIRAGNDTFRKTGMYLKSSILCQRIFIVTDSGIQQAGYVQELEQVLQREGYITDVFTQVQPNPRDTDCMAGGEAAQRFAAEVILALGGGSVIDSAKAIAILQRLGGRPQDYQGRDQILGDVTPVVAIPTTAGTGAEVTRSSVITDTTRKEKLTIKDVKIAPKLAIVDPTLTHALPPSLTASTGMDALVHAIEAYTCKRANPISDGLALQAMHYIFPHLRAAFEDGTNERARYNLMIGSTIAGMAFSHADVASVHCMAEAIGGRYDIAHGVANSIFLPYVLAYNAQTDITKHANIARTIGLTSTQDDHEATDILVQEMKQLALDLSIPSLSSFAQVKEHDFNQLAEAAEANGSTPSNVRTMTKSDYLYLFKQTYKGY